MPFAFRLPSPDVREGLPDRHHRPGVDAQGDMERWWAEVARVFPHQGDAPARRRHADGADEPGRRR